LYFRCNPLRNISAYRLYFFFRSVNSKRLLAPISLKCKWKYEAFSVFLSANHTNQKNPIDSRENSAYSKERKSARGTNEGATNMIFEKLCALISEQFTVDADSITMDTSFADDLNADSVEIVDLSMALEDEFGIEELSEEEIASISTVGDLVRFLQNKVD